MGERPTLAQYPDLQTLSRFAALELSAASLSSKAPATTRFNLGHRLQLQISAADSYNWPNHQLGQARHENCSAKKGKIFCCLGEASCRALNGFAHAQTLLMRSSDIPAHGDPLSAGAAAITPAAKIEEIGGDVVSDGQAGGKGLADLTRTLTAGPGIDEKSACAPGSGAIGLAHVGAVGVDQVNMGARLQGGLRTNGFSLR
jgi:hypothetical protein